jgi:type I restriction enzyme S subunit
MQHVRLGDVAQINPRFDKSSLADDVPVSFVQMASVGAADGKINVSIVRPFAEVKKGSYTPFKDGDVLFAKVTPCMENGKMAVARGLTNGVGFGSSEFHVLRPSDQVDAKYLYYFVSSQAFRKEAAGHMTGAVGLRRVPAAFLADKEIPLVPLDEQRRIVAEIEQQFSRLDEAVANLQRVKANFKRYKASVLKSAVEGRLVETEASIAQREGRNYETGEQLLQRILDERRAKWTGKGKYKEPLLPVTEDLPTLPDGWTWATLDSLAALKGGITVDSKRVDSSARLVPYMRVANVQRGFIDLAEVKQINASPADIEELRLEHGDVLFNEGGDRDKLGRGWIWEGQLGDCIHQNHVFRARMYLGAMSPKLVSWWGNTFGKDYFLRVGKQTTNLASINLGKLSEFPVPVPPRTEQLRMVQEIERLLSVVDEVEADVDSNLQRALLLRRATLNKAFSMRIPA